MEYNQINLKKYTYNGWGLSRPALEFLNNLIRDKNLTSAIDFGSGQSTRFLKDIGIDFISFENSTQYAITLEEVIIKELRQLDDSTFEKVIKGDLRYIDVCENFQPPSKVHTRQRNCFYSMKGVKFNSKYDLILLDGPNGNGRSIAYNIIKPYLQKEAYILIDDYTHHPYIENFNLTFPNVELIKEFKNGRDVWVVYKIIS